VPETTSTDAGPAGPERGLATLAEEDPPASEDLAEPGSSRADMRRLRARRRWVTLIVPPFVAFLFAELLLYVSAKLDGSTQDFFSPSHWARYDSAIYVQIAAHGYALTRCPGPPLYPPHSWCGTASWAPLYPGLISLLGHVGLSLPVAAMVLSIVFAYLTLQAMWILIGPSWTFTSLCCLALAACFPGMVYYYALFPVSLMTFLAIVSITLFIRRHYLLAGVAGALCAWAFAIGPLIALVLLVAAVLVDRGRDFWRRAALSAGVAAAGFGLLLLADQRWVGRWDAYFKVQSKYGNGLHDPITTFVMAFTGGPNAKYPLQNPNPGYDHVVAQAQTAFVAALVIGLVIWTLRRRPVGRAEWVVLSYTVVFWLVPLVDGPSLGRYRLEALLVPCAALCTRLPRVVQVVLVGTSAVLAVGLASLFSKYLIL